MDMRGLEIPELKLIVPGVSRDVRGFLAETYNAKRLTENGIDAVFVQDNHFYSACRGTLRGLHFQVPPHGQGKLIRVLKGSTFEVAADIRYGSPTFGRYATAHLSARDWTQLWVPEGFAHGFCTLEPETEVLHKVTDFDAPASDHGIPFDDPAFAIAWPVTPRDLIVSDRDRRQLKLADQPRWFHFAGRSRPEVSPAKPIF